MNYVAHAAITPTDWSIFDSASVGLRDISGAKNPSVVSAEALFTDKDVQEPLMLLLCCCSNSKLQQVNAPALLNGLLG